MSRLPVCINWGVSSFFGWGVYGLNLALSWSLDPDLSPVSAHKITDQAIVVDPLRRRVLEPFLQRSAGFQAQLEPFRGGFADIDRPVLNYFDENFLLSPSVHGVWLRGRPSIAATFFETTQVSPEAIARAATFPLVVTGSSWNTQILEARGLKNVRKVIQGVDPTLFHVAPRRGVMADRFLVFSGGKLEHRKGQDIVVAAFRRFAERHPDALLVSVWNNPMASSLATINDSALTQPMPIRDGAGDIPAWVATNGIGPDNVLNLGPVPNALLPTVLREMDVAVFPNRAEGGTNLVAMECMACGVPTILSRNTGHMDLIEQDNCYPLVQQGALAGRAGGMDGVAGWGESDVGEVVETLERVYQNREAARARGLRGARSLSDFTWDETARHMKAIILEAL